MHTDRIPADTRSQSIKRLRRAAGQLQAVARMLEEGADCVQVLRQLAAGKSAAERAGVQLLSAGLVACLSSREDDDLAPEDFEKLFMTLA